MGATGATPTLAGPRPLEGGDCSPARREPPQRVSLDHDRPAGAPPGWGQPPGARRPTEETRALYVDHHDPPGDLPRAERGPPLRGDPRRRLPRRHHPVARLCRPGAPAPGAGVVRFEAAPGQQAQVDFAESRVPWGKRFALLDV